MDRRSGSYGLLGGTLPRSSAFLWDVETRIEDGRHSWPWQINRWHPMAIWPSSDLDALRDGHGEVSAIEHFPGSKTDVMTRSGDSRNASAPGGYLSNSSDYVSSTGWVCELKHRWFPNRVWLNEKLPN